MNIFKLPIHKLNLDSTIIRNWLYEVVRYGLKFQIGNLEPLAILQYQIIAYLPIEFSTQHQIRVLKVAGVTEWLKKTEEKYKQQVKDKQNNLCSESSIPKIKNLDSHAKIVDNFLQFRPRLFSTAHEIQFEAGKNPLNHEQMNRSSHEILEKVYNKNKAYKKSILAKHLGGELIASGSEDVNQSNGELLRQKIDEFILSKGVGFWRCTVV